MTSRPRLPRFYDTTNASGLAPKSLSDALFGVDNPLAFWAGHYFSHSESPYFMFHPCIAFPGPSIFGLRLSSALVFSTGGGHQQIRWDFSYHGYGAES